MNKLLNLPGITVRGVSLPTEPGHPMVVDVALRRQLLTCPLCDQHPRRGAGDRPATQLRAGNAGSARGAAALVAEAVATTKAVLAARSAVPTTTATPAVGSEIVVRADLAFYSRTVITACRLPPAAGSGSGSRSRSASTPSSAGRSPRSARTRGLKSVIHNRSGTKTSNGSSPARRSPKPPTPRSKAPATRSPPGSSCAASPT
jgi:hypothetical protein